MKNIILSEDSKDAARRTLPARGVQGLFYYFEHHVEPGGFLTALLSNDLTETFVRADEINKEVVYDYVYWLYNYAPSGSWGSPAAVKNWLEKRGADDEPRLYADNPKPE